MGPLPRRALAAAAAVAVLAIGGGNLFIARADGSGAACVRTGMLLTSGARWRPGP